MADTKYSGLTGVAAALTTHEWGVNEGGVSKKITLAQVMALLPNGKLGYAQVTATQGTFTTATDITNLTVTLTAAQCNGRRIKLSCNIGASSSVAADLVAVQIQEGATVLQICQFPCTLSANAFMTHVEIAILPTNAIHTYKIVMLRVAGTGNITMQAGATFPAYILAEDIGT